jgi:hypothetical protein
MSSLFTVIFIASIVWFFIARRKDKKVNGKITNNTWYILILTAVSFIFVGITTPTQNIQTNKSSSKSTITSSSNKALSKKVSSSSSSKQKNKINKSTKDSQLQALNDWYKNDYDDEQDEAYQKDGKEYFGTKEYIMSTVLKGFTVESNELYAVIDYNRLKAEKLTQKEVANFAFNVVYTDYSGHLHYDNLNTDGSIKQDVMIHPDYYSTLE